MSAMDFPFASIIIPIRNEEKYIVRCLDSILENEYPREQLEILLIDGQSEDRTRLIIKEYLQKFPFISMLDNPKRIQVVALNLGIHSAQGSIIVRMDAHTVYPSNYISECVHLLRTKGASNVGGLMVAEGQNYVSKAIALAVTCPFGVGDAKYRVATKEEWVDTIFPGVWSKQTLLDLGGFQEDWVINEDYELNFRLRQMGGKILLSPTIKCHYFVRDSIVSMIKQYSRYGFWKVKTIVTHPDSLRWRQMIPPLFVIGLVLSLFLLLVNPLFVAIPLTYLILNLSYTARLSYHKGYKYFPLLPFLFLSIHLSWGMGFLCGLFKWGTPKVSWSNIKASFQAVYPVEAKQKSGEEK
jgi:succinoglycan biosynthesis protein ExoA